MLAALGTSVKSGQRGNGVGQRGSGGGVGWQKGGGEGSWFWNIISSPFFILTLACIVCYGNSLTCGFVFDDLSAIKDNKDIKADYPFEKQFYDFLWNDFWGIPMYKEQSHKSYRPLTVLTYRINYLLHGLAPYGYHLANLILHTCVTLLYFITINSILTNKEKQINDHTALIASLLFAVHPIHTEAVTGVVGRAELLSSLFFLLSALIYTSIHDNSNTGYSDSWQIFQCCLFSGLAIISKEQGVTVLGFCMIYEVYQLFHNQPTYKVLSLKAFKYNWKSLYRMMCLSLTAVILLTFRIHLMQGSSLPVFTRYDNPASVAPPLPRALTFLLLPSYNLALLLSPSPLCCDWTMGSIPLVYSLSDCRNLLTVFLFTFLLHAAHNLIKSDGYARLSLLISLSLLILPFLPATNILFSVGFVIAERVLYLPSMGFSLLVAIGLTKLYKQCKLWSTMKTILQLTLVLVIIIHASKTILRNRDWKDEESLFLSGLKVNKNNAKLYNNVGHAYESMKRHKDALMLYQQAAWVQPDDIGAHINIGRALNHLGRPDEAETAYRTAKRLLPWGKPGDKSGVARIAPNSLNLFLNLGNLISRNGSRLEEADRLYRQAIAMRSDYIQAYINRGDILIKMNKTDEAMEVYKEALKHDPENSDLYYNLGVVSIEQGNSMQGLQYMNTALQYKPTHTEALLNSAILIQELKLVDQHQVGIDRLLSLVSLQPNNEKALFNLGMITMDEGWTWESEYWFKKAIEIVPDFRGALFNLALLLTDQHRPMDAVPYLQTLLQFYPNHTKGLILLGDIYTNIVKDLEQAELMYKRILAVTPDHVQAKHNLCVLDVERNNLEGAELCFQKLAQQAPKEDYIRKHLRIVQTKIKKKQNAKKIEKP